MRTNMFNEGVLNQTPNVSIDGLAMQVVGDFGEDWDTLPKILASAPTEKEVQFVIASNTNGDGSVRFYVYSAVVGAWKYVALS